MNELIKNKKKSEILVEKIISMDFGDTILHSEIADLIREPYPSQKYNSTIQKAKKVLLKEYGRHIECVRGDGYRITHPDDFTGASLKHYNRGFREMKKGEDVLTYAPVQHMSEEGRITYRRVHDRAVILNASMRGAKVEMKALSKKQHPFALAEGK